METALEYVTGDFAERCKEVEEFLFEHCRTHPRDSWLNLPPSGRALLMREMGLGEKEANQEIRRVNTVIKLQAIAGTPEQREAARQELQATVGVLKTQGPNIRKERDELDAKLARMERDVTSAKKRVEQHAEAVQRLREYVRASVAEQVSRNRRIVEAGIGQELRNAKTRLTELRNILNIDNVYRTEAKHLDFGLKTLLPAAVSESVDSGNSIHRGYSPEWPELQAKCQTEYNELSERLPGLQAEYGEAISKAEQPLDCYSCGNVNRG